jgi:hypothetical protein
MKPTKRMNNPWHVSNLEGNKDKKKAIYQLVLPFSFAN